MNDDDQYNFSGLFAAIAVPMVISGLIGFYTGIVPVHMCVAAVVALYLMLCVSNALNNSYNAKRHKRKEKRK